ncbi:unnamed protein product [Schistosoma margrebowiei]|uniref:J domain-containing protein n=1 Tax=Schistosoma margrebowiei TaxID=48269 RepID=A0AA85AE52_9TREM|nr:unnamed protein product [Schistosoma margrebowiei]
MFHLATKFPSLVSTSINHRLSAVFSSKVDSLYSVFGLSSNATHQDIKEAFYRLSKIYHPDVTDDPNSREKFHELTKAYEILGNPVRRSEYDRGLIHTIGSGVHHFSKDGYTIDSVKDRSTDSFKSFYVKQHNRTLNEFWAKHSDRESMMSATELRNDHKGVLGMLFMTVLYTILVGYFYAKYYEEPIEFIRPSQD